ncbi:hypothetical protein H0H93_002844 [Arthromyces matolae]|nr:hypothetical protein H0H93_002844 [Arthromyces matolae]
MGTGCGQVAHCPQPVPKPADNPADIVTGKRKRFIEEQAQNAVTTVRKVISRLSPPRKQKPSTPIKSETHRNSTSSASTVTPGIEPALKKTRVTKILSDDDGSDNEQASVDVRDSARASSPEIEVATREETDQLELEKMQKGWRTSVYAFFQPDPEIIYDKSGRKSHVFTCTAKGCRAKITRYLDTKDAQSTSNLRKHVRKCWGEDVLEAADNAKDKDVARKDIVEKYKQNGSITAAFERKGKGKVTYSHRAHSRTQTRTEIVRWVCESYRPFTIVQDRGFNCLMKTGRPEYYLPRPTTVSRDVKAEYDGQLTVQFLMQDKPISLLLDIVEVAKPSDSQSHSGLVLATAFAKVLEDFGICEKVRLDRESQAIPGF